MHVALAMANLEIIRIFTVCYIVFRAEGTEPDDQRAGQEDRCQARQENRQESTFKGTLPRKSGDDGYTPNIFN